MTITGSALQDHARTTARALPQVSEGYPFTDRLQVFKVAGRVFLIVTEDPDEPIITVKVEPEHAEALVGEHGSIEPGRYLNKRHWISVAAGPSITADLVHGLVHDSHDLIMETLPKSHPAHQPE